MRYAALVAFASLLALPCGAQTLPMPKPRQLTDYEKCERMADGPVGDMLAMDVDHLRRCADSLFGAADYEHATLVLFALDGANQDRIDRLADTAGKMYEELEQKYNQLSTSYGTLYSLTGQVLDSNAKLLATQSKESSKPGFVSQFLYNFSQNLNYNLSHMPPPQPEPTTIIVRPSPSPSYCSALSFPAGNMVRTDVNCF